MRNFANGCADLDRECSGGTGLRGVWAYGRFFIPTYSQTPKPRGSIFRDFYTARHTSASSDRKRTSMGNHERAYALKEPPILRQMCARPPPIFYGGRPLRRIHYKCKFRAPWPTATECFSGQMLSGARCPLGRPSAPLRWPRRDGRVRGNLSNRCPLARPRIPRHLWHERTDFLPLSPHGRHG